LLPLIIDLFTIAVNGAWGAKMKIGIAVVASLILCPQALCPQAMAEPVPYVVDGVAIGTQLNLNNAAYREYKCSPSDQFTGLTWCQKARTEKDRGKAYGAAYSLLHAPDGNVVYINRSQEPSFFNSTQAQQDIERYSHKLGESARLIKMPVRSGLPQGLIATWGQITLVPLDQASVKILSEGKSPKKGLLIDFLGNFVRSAKEGLPIYRIAGGSGFVWTASFDQKGRGALRTAAVDASIVATAAPQLQATAEQGQTAGPEPTADPELTGEPVAASDLQTAEPDAGSDAQLTSRSEPISQTQPVSQSEPGSEAEPTAPIADIAETDPLALMQKIEKLQGELASATASIAELEKGKAAAQAAQKEAAKARRDAETARREIEQAAATDRAKLQKLLAQLEADGTAPAKNKRWENALYGSMGGLLIVLIASAIGFFLKRYNARTSGMGATDTSAQLQSNAAEVETFVASPAIAIAEDAFGRELEQQVAALNATQTETEPETKIETESKVEIPAAEEGKSKEIETVPATA
jgi:hypothetical protein